MTEGVLSLSPLGQVDNIKTEVTPRPLIICGPRSLPCCRYRSKKCLGIDRRFIIVIGDWLWGELLSTVDWLFNIMNGDWPLSISLADCQRFGGLSR